MLIPALLSLNKFSFSPLPFDSRFCRASSTSPGHPASPCRAANQYHHPLSVSPEMETSADGKRRYNLRQRESEAQPESNLQVPNLQVPQRPYDWEREAKKEKITAPEKNRPHGDRLPLGKRSVHVVLRNLSGWNSASKIKTQYGHYLSTKILWGWDPVASLVDANHRICVLLNISNWAKVAASDYLLNYQDWHRYLSHIDQYPVVQPDNPILIGAFSSVRDQQARIEGASLDLPEHGSPSPSPAKKRKLSTLEDSTCQPMTSGTTTPSIIPNPEDMARRLQNMSLESRETANTGGYTALIKSFMELPLYKDYPVEKNTHEAKINASFINLLYNLCLLIRTELKWENIQRKFELKLGYAEYTAVLDGGLVDLDGNCHVIVEVKARAIDEKKMRALLMQLGLEMLAWVVTTLGISENMPEDKKVKLNRSILSPQHSKNITDQCSTGGP